MPKEDNVRITIELSKQSVNFFKKEAKKNNALYQRMIRAVLDEYSNTYSNNN